MRLLTKGPEFQSLFKIHHYTRIPGASTGAAAPGEAQDTVRKVSVNRENLVSSQEEQYFGYLKVNIALGTRLPDTLSSIGFPVRKENSAVAQVIIQPSTRPVVTAPPQPAPPRPDVAPPPAASPQLREEVPFQLLLSLRKVRLLDKVRRNLFVNYKIYGTAESNKTEELEHAYEGDLQHCFVFSVVRSTV